MKNEHSKEANMEERILQEAEKLFLEKGFSMASTTEITKRVGCNQALVHYYFRTKENLFNRIFENKFKRLFIELITIETQGKTFREKLSCMIGIHYDIIRQNSNLVLFLLNELTRCPQRISEIKKIMGDLPVTTLRSLYTDLKEEIARGNIRQIELIDLILNVISMNVFTFLIRPLLANAWNMSDEKMERLTDRRKEEIITTILLSLRP
ncbi:MAG: TetR/AcrR family transcriptional regulator [Bacteroides sp.]|nr:TetR/AcrR family transcriptional regulator [Bacteroides sp.]